MRVTIYALSDDPDCVKFDCEVAESPITGTSWPDYQPIAVIDADSATVEKDPEAKLYGVSEYRLVVVAEGGKKVYTAQQVLCGDAGKAVTILWCLSDVATA